MSLKKDTLIRVQHAFVLIADEGVEKPDYKTLDPKNPPAPWSILGYTTKDEVVKIVSNGGETKLIDTAAEDGVDSATSPKTRDLEFYALQIESSTLDLAYNGAYNDATGEYDVPTNAEPLVKQVFVVMKTWAGKTVTLRGFGTISTGEEPSLSFTELSKVHLKVNLRTDSNGHNLHWGGDNIKSAADAAAALVDAVATATISGGGITGVTVTNGGTGYTNAATVAITSTGSGAGATATLTISGGVITAVNVTAAGTGYTAGTTSVVITR